jgi:hypothetical protein
VYTHPPGGRIFRVCEIWKRRRRLIRKTVTLSAETITLCLCSGHNIFSGRVNGSFFLTSLSHGLRRAGSHCLCYKVPYEKNWKFSVNYPKGYWSKFRLPYGLHWYGFYMGILSSRNTTQMAFCSSRNTTQMAFAVIVTLHRWLH